MSDNVVARLRILLGMDSAEVNASARQTDKEVTKMSKGIASAAKIATTALGALGAAFTVDAVVRVTKEAIKYTTEIKSQAREAGVTTKSLQEYRYAALMAGVSNDQLADGLKELNLKIGEAADGSKSAAAMFGDYGVSIRDANGQVRNAADILPELADAYMSLQSPAERATFAAKLFGEEAGPKMQALLEQGKAGMNNYRAAAEELGMVISDVNIKKAEDAEKKMAALSRVLSVNIATFVAENADAIANLTDKLLELAGAAVRAMNAWNKWQGGPGSPSAQAENLRIIRQNRGDVLTGSSPIGDTYAVGDRGTTRRTGYIDAFGNPYTKDRRIRLPKGGRGGGGGANAIGSSLFGGTDFAQFMPGTAGPDWIKAAANDYVDIAASAAEMARENDKARVTLAEMANEHSPRLLSNVKALVPEMARLDADLQRILDRLYPEEARAREYRDEAALLNEGLKAGRISAEDHRRAIADLRNEYTGLTEALRETQIAVVDGGKSLDDISDDISDRLPKALRSVDDAADELRVRFVGSFAQMTDGALREVNRFVSGIKSGNFLDIIGGLLGAIDGIAGIVTGGKGTKIFGMSFGGGGRVPGAATGIDGTLGGYSGVDRNLLSMNGEPMLRVSRGEKLTITPANDRGGMGGGGQDGTLTVRLEKDGSMSAYLAGIAGQVVDARTPAIAKGAASAAVAKVGRLQQKMIG